MKFRDLFNRPVQELTLEDQVKAHTFLKILGERLQRRLAELRPLLLAHAREAGEPVLSEGQPTGSKRLVVAGTRVYSKRTTVKEPDTDSMLALLEKHSLQPISAFDAVSSWVYNPSKVEALIEIGVLTQAEIEALRKETEALVVDPSKELKALAAEADRVIDLELPEKRSDQLPASV